MNDFTKEELEMIRDDLDKMADNDFNRNLRNKTQRMIDNYCYHERQGQLSDVDYITYCKQCDEILGPV